MFLGIDDGLVNGYNDLADICFLIAAILFLFAFIFRVRLTPASGVHDLTMIGGFIALAIGFFVL